MTEIPMPTDDQARPSGESDGGRCSTKLIAVVVVVIVIGAAAAFILLSGPSGPQTRTIATYEDEDIELWPTFYREEFTVTSSETQTDTQPDLKFLIDVSTGSDSVSVDIYVEVYDCNLATFDSLSWSELGDDYLVDWETDSDSLDDFIDLHNYAETYTWVIYFTASEKTDTWSVDIDLSLRYNWP